MIPSDQGPAGTDWISRRLTELERQVRELQAGRRLEAATIGRGGLTVKGGTVNVTDSGNVIIHDDQGHAMLWLGKVPFGPGVTKPGMVAFRAGGGPVAMSLYDGLFAVWDKFSNVVLATDENSGQGIARPWLPVTWAGSDFTQWPGTTSGTFAMVLETAVSRQQPKLFARIKHTTDVSGTTGELRLMCDGEQLGATIPVAFAINYTDIGPIALPAGNFGDIIGMSVDGRRTAGTGAVRAMVTASWTQQS